MASSSARNLQLVNKQTGEITAEACPGCFQRDEEIASLRVEKRGWSARYYNLKREYEADENHDLFPAAIRLFKFWQQRCNHPKTKFAAEHFKACLPYLRDYGEEMCRRAIEGVAYDPYITIRKNGSPKRHDGWTNIVFKNTESFTEHANKAPHHLPKPEHIVTLAKALTFLNSDWPLERAIEEARERLKR